MRGEVILLLSEFGVSLSLKISLGFIFVLRKTVEHICDTEFSDLWCLLFDTFKENKIEQYYDTKQYRYRLKSTAVSVSAYCSQK